MRGGGGLRGARVSEFTKDPNLKKNLFFCWAGVGGGDGGGGGGGTTGSVSEFF